MAEEHNFFLDFVLRELKKENKGRTPQKIEAFGLWKIKKQ